MHDLRSQKRLRLCLAWACFPEVTLHSAGALAAGADRLKALISDITYPSMYSGFRICPERPEPLPW